MAFSLAKNLIEYVYMEFDSSDNQESAKPISRRDAMKAGFLVGLVAMASDYFPATEAKAQENLYRTINGVEVYGLNEKLTNQEQIDDLTFQFELDFERKLGWKDKQKNLWEQREIVLPKDKRFVEFVVTESTFNSFESRKEETGLNYVEWVQIHIDLLNRVLKNSKPPVELITQLSRIIVVSDGFENSPVKYTKDIDGIWFENKDNRVPQGVGNIGQNSFWSIKHDVEGDLVLQNPAGASFGRTIEVPRDNDQLEKTKDGVWIDFGLIHELSHVLLNLPDEYVFSYEGVKSIFENFRYNTGSFMEPKLSAYLSLLLTRNMDKGLRGYYTSPGSIGMAKEMKEKYNFYGELPSKVGFKIANSEVTGISKSHFLFSDYYDKKDGGGNSISCKDMMKADFVINGQGAVNLENSSFVPQLIDDEELYPVLFRVECNKVGEEKELYIPIGIFNMSKYSGVEEAIYDIEFISNAPADMKSQALNLIDGSEVDEFLSKNASYAKMKVIGTNTWCVWTFQY